MTTTTPMHESGPAIEFSHKVEVELRMASVCYLHSTAFIRELNSCASDFLHFLSQVASSITTGWTVNDAVFWRMIPCKALQSLKFLTLNLCGFDPGLEAGSR